MRWGASAVRVDTRPHSGLQRGLFAAPIALLGGAAWAHRNVIDDGFIYLRIVHQVVAGHGPVFNTGQRVEAYTSPLWLAVLSVADLLTPLRVEWLAVVLGIAFTLVGCGFAIIGSARLARQDRPRVLLVPFGSLVLAALVPMWFYASSGLETGMTFLWLGASFWILAHWSTSTQRLSSGRAVVLGLGWLVRPELVLYSVAFLLVVAVHQWSTDSRRQRLRFAAAAVALPAAYQLFRMGYFGAIVANTAIAKEGTRVRWQRGWRYFLNFVEPYWFVLPAALIVAGGYAPLARGLRRGGCRRGTSVVVAFFVAACLNALYVVAVGGDYEHARLLLPSVFAICAPIAMIPATRRLLAAGALVPWLIAAAFVLRAPAPSFSHGFQIPIPGIVTTNQAGWEAGGPKLGDMSRPGLYVQNLSARFSRTDLPILRGVHQPVAVAFAVGAPGLAAGNDVYVFDVFGLADPLTARMRAPFRTALLPYPGHEKLLPRAWIAARLIPPGVHVDPLQLPVNDYYALIPTVQGAAFDDQVRWARAALQCPAIRQLDRDTTAPLTLSRFIGNVFDSFSNTSLRIAPDPETADHALCGNGSR